MSKSNKLTVGILTASDRCFEGAAVDHSGENLRRLVISNLIPNKNAEVTDTKCVPDVQQMIVEALIDWCDGRVLNLILTTGGTGFSPRDVTPEAVKQVIEREAAGVCTLMTSTFMNVKPISVLSRSVCGIRKRTIIVTLPGNLTGSEECFRCIAPVLGHAVDVLLSRHGSVDEIHKREHREMIFASRTPILSSPRTNVDLSKVALRARKSPYPTITVTRALKKLFDVADSLNTEIDTIHINRAHGFVIAKDVVSQICVPPFRASVKDGYAVRSSDGTANRVVVGSLSAGDKIDPAIELGSRPCMRINTGAPVPDWADCVVKVEDTDLLRHSDDYTEEIEIRLLCVPYPDEEIRPIGCDVQKGEIVVRQHTLLHAAEIGVLASIGTIQTDVYKKPIVGLLSTGKEVQSVDNGVLKPYKIYDSNLPLLGALLKANDFPQMTGGIVQDEPQALLTGLLGLLDRGADILVTTGSVSMGDKDMLKNVLTDDFDATIHFAQVFMKPGKPTTFATFMYKGKPKMVLGLPGNPVSATVTANLYLIPLCKKLAGRRDYEHRKFKVQLTHCFPLSDRPEYHRVIIVHGTDAVLPQAYSTGEQMSSKLTSCVKSNGLLLLPSIENNVVMKNEGDVMEAIAIN